MYDISGIFELECRVSVWETHHWPAGLLGVDAHPSQQSIVSKPGADGVGDLGRVPAESTEPSLDNVRHVALLPTRCVPVNNATVRCVCASILVKRSSFSTQCFGACIPMYGQK